MFNKTVIISLVLGINTLLGGDNNISTIMQQDISTVQNLLRDKSIHKRYKEQKTLLHYAVQADNFDAVSFLVRKNISLSAQ
jgi:putative IMPACT (imprinted ancient) family translation regulator